MHTQVVTSAVRPIPSEWIALPRLQVVVSIDGLQPEHDERRKPATYERILKHIEGHQITVHCTVTRQQARRDGYLKEFLDFWQANADTRLIWVSLYTPQVGELSMERLTAGDRAKVIGEMRRLRLQVLEVPDVRRPPRRLRQAARVAGGLHLRADDGVLLVGFRAPHRALSVRRKTGLRELRLHRLSRPERDRASSSRWRSSGRKDLLRIARGRQDRRARQARDVRLTRSPPGLISAASAEAWVTSFTLLPLLRSLPLPPRCNLFSVLNFTAGTSVAPTSRVRIASSTLLLLILATSGLSLSAQQPAKQEPEPPDEGRLKSIARKLGTLASPDDKEGISIEAGIIVAGSGLSGGVGYRRLNLFNSPIDVEVEGTMSVRLYQAYRASIGLLGERSSTLEFDTADSKVSSLFNASAPKTPGSAVFLEMRYRDYPRHTYYGTGISSLEENRADYALRGMSVEGVWQWQITPTLGFGARGGWLGLDIGRGHNDSILDLEDRFIPATVSGAIAQPEFLTYGAGSCTTLEATPGFRKTGGCSEPRFAGSRHRTWSGFRSRASRWTSAPINGHSRSAASSPCAVWSRPI